MSTFDDLLAAVLLYIDSWEGNDEDGVTKAWDVLLEEAEGAETFTSKQRERIFRDAAIREAARRGEPYADIAYRYGLSQPAISLIAQAGGVHRRMKGAA